ncbi:MAG TPA: hypothetical protein PK034_03385 [Rugosibacter sp.]|nr:hypothetical protein [Rugosibacter sp.]
MSFAEFSPDQVKAKHVAQLIDAYRETPSMTNMMRNVLKMIFNKAVLLGLTDSNPVASVPPLKTKRRDRYITEQELSKNFRQLWTSATSRGNVLVMC